MQTQKSPSGMSRESGVEAWVFAGSNDIKLLFIDISAMTPGIVISLRTYSVPMPRASARPMASRWPYQDSWEA